MALTKTDLKQIDNLVEVKFKRYDKSMDNKFKQQRENITLDLADHIDRVLAKFTDEFFTKIDPILKEVQASREERVLVNARLTKLEEAQAQ